MFSFKFPALVFVLATSIVAGAQHTENYKNLIEKARNLTLQRDRLQASQVLQRGLAKESKTSTAFKEMSKALDELMVLFYTEKGQSLFAQGDSSNEVNPRASIESYQAALREEDGNVTVLKALARTHLRFGECDKADTYVKQAETMSPFAAEVKLLRLQSLDCSSQVEQLSSQLALNEADLAPVDKFVKGLQVKDAQRRKDAKRAKMLLTAWEQSSPDYPEVFYWKYKLSADSGPLDRAAANKYVQLCKNLSLRKKKSFNLDVDLCKNSDKVDEEIKAAPQDAAAGGSGTNG